MGDHARFERLVRPVLGDLYRFACRLTRDPVTAEDLLQTSLLRGLGRLAQLQDDRAFRVWQSRVLYTTFLNARDRRADMHVGVEALDGAPVPTADPAHAAANRQLGRHIGDALDRLPADQREAVWLVDGQGMKFSEAAEILGLPPGTVASRVARGRTALRSSLAAVAGEVGR